MKQSTVSTVPCNNCLEFECGDLKLKVPESAMNDQFKSNMGTVTGLAVGTVLIVFGIGLIKIINNNIPQQYQYPMYYVPQQPYFPQQMNMPCHM